MKLRFIQSLLFLLAFVPLIKAQEPADTVKVIENAQTVTVIRDGNHTVVTADYMQSPGVLSQYKYEVNVDENPDYDFSDDWGMDLPFARNRCIDCEKRRSHAKVIRSVTGGRHIFWGWRFNYGDKGALKNCFELGIRDLIGVTWRKRGAELEIGLGFGFRRFLADDGFSFSKVGDAIRMLPVPNELEIKHSRLDVFSWQIPVLYNQRIYREFSFSLGAVMNLNTYAKSHVEWMDGNYKEKVSYKGLQQNLFTVEPLAAFYISGVGIYASWSPMKLFKHEYGPAVKAWSIGVDLNF